MLMTILSPFTDDNTNLLTSPVTSSVPLLLSDAIMFTMHHYMQCLHHHHTPDKQHQQDTWAATDDAKRQLTCEQCAKPAFNQKIVI